MLAPILQRVVDVGGKVFTKGDYNLNLIGIRNPQAQPNAFDDAMHVVYKENGRWIDRWWPITTDPGTYWLEHPMNEAGTAIVVADRQYRGVWEIGQHRGKYTALVQTGAKIAVYRDDDRDGKTDLDPDTIQEGYFGINCHRSTTRSGGSLSVDKWSAGCQVFQSPYDFSEFMDICQKQVALRGFQSFSYTLLNGGW